jgi:monomeric isocitrate dehydrogenase
MQDYAQNSASGEYQNAFNRYQTERNARLNPLQSLAGVGQSATNFTGAAGAQNAATMGNYLTGGAAAQAAGQVGSANAITSGLGTYLNYTSNNNLVNALRNQGSGMTNADVTAAMNPYFTGG